MCEQWFEKIEECTKGNEKNEAGLEVCCRGRGIPYECSRYCTFKEVASMRIWKCGNWHQEIRNCLEYNNGYVCCKKQGVPRKCLAYCETP